MKVVVLNFLVFFWGICFLKTGGVVNGQQELSRKSRKFQNQQEQSSGLNNVVSSTTTTTSTTEDSISDFQIASPPTTTEDPFFDFGFDDNGALSDDDVWDWDDELPLCESLFENEDKIPGVTCDNSTMIEVAEIRHRDPIFERLLSQIWSDFQYKLNTEAQLYGHVLDPFDVDAKLPEPIDIRQVGTGYTADVQMHGIKIHGLSGINLDSIEVTRSENLTDFHVDIVFAFDKLEINGTYALKGHIGWWDLDSVGEQLFSIQIVNATIAYKMKVEILDPSLNWNPMSGCQPSFNDDVNLIDDDKVVIDEILIPLEYDDVDFRFNNLGTFANTVVNGIGVFFLKSQEDVLIGAIKKLIQQNVHSLIC